MRGAWCLLIAAVACSEEPAAAPDAGPKPVAKPAPPPAVPDPEKMAEKLREAAGLPKPTQVGATIGREEIEKYIAILSRYVKAGATEAKSPWALAHGLLAFGPDMLADDGRLAIDVIVSDYARAEKVKGGVAVRFDEKSPAGEPIEPHNNLMAKAMAEAGVPMTRAFTLKGGDKVSMRDLVRATEIDARTPKNDREWHDFAWTYGAVLAAGGTPAEKGPVLALAALSYVEEQQAFLTRLMEAGKPDEVVKKKQLIYSHTCGGLHMVQAALRGASALDEVHKKRARAQLDTVLFRHLAERRIYREMIRKYPQYKTILLTQELKFYGHALETAALAVQWGLVPADATLRAKVEPIIRDLMGTVDALYIDYADLQSVRTAAKQTYLDLIGDGCHAIRGLREALVAFFPPR